LPTNLNIYSLFFVFSGKFYFSIEFFNFFFKAKFDFFKANFFFMFDFV